MSRRERSGSPFMFLISMRYSLGTPAQRFVAGDDHVHLAGEHGIRGLVQFFLLTGGELIEVLLGRLVFGDSRGRCRRRAC